uniref:Uncharacterized protein n=1 Tax=Panagrolaimus sp. ES5 TaxID=591445 RepID=A0AC34F5K5_9BILA
MPVVLNSNYKNIAMNQGPSIQPCLPPLKKENQKDLNIQRKKNEKSTTTQAQKIVKQYNREFRQVSIQEILIGCNNRGIPDTRMVVPEANDATTVKEYTKLNNLGWYCVRCKKLGRQNYGKKIGDTFLAPVLHLSNCAPISKAEAENTLRKNSLPRKMTAQFQQSPRLTSDINENEPLSTTNFTAAIIESNENFRHSENSENERQNNLTTLLNTENEQNVSFSLSEIQQQLPIIMHLPQPESAFDQTLKVSHENPKKFFEFNHPSAKWLKNACKKLNISYHHEAYCIWAKINISSITETSKPKDVCKMTDEKFSSFCALSYLVSGKENEKVGNAIKNNFYDCFKTLGIVGGIDFSTLTHESEIIKQNIFAEYLTPELWEIVVKMLECRIGIFNENKFVKYGDWDNTQNESSDKNYEIYTLLFQIIDEKYYIVKSLVTDF